MTTIFVSKLRKCQATGEASRLLEEAANEIERLAREAWTWSKACETATKQLETTRFDAKRYCWLRENRDVLLITGFFGNGCINRTIDEVDAAIDAAMLKTPNG